MKFNFRFFANDKVAKFKFRLLLQFYESLNDSSYD